jgi:glycosyltransferase involved in cell wall biosynthesis
MQNLLFITFLLIMQIKSGIDYGVVGYYKPADGLGQIHICFYEALNQLGRSDFITTFAHYNIPADYYVGKLDKYYDAIFFADQLGNRHHKPIKFLPVNANLKIAYSMFETDEIPLNWVTILNQKFNAVIVPDIFLKNVYEESGVLIPIFVIPAPIYKIADINNLQPKKKSDKFIFLYSSSFSDRKNQITLLKAFNSKFANNPNYELILHGRYADDTLEKIQIDIQDSNLQNVKIINNKLDRQEYLKLFQNASCYVSPSKGEGFAIPPREALAAGLPVILTNCAAQSSLCKNHFYISVPADLEEDCYYKKFDAHIGKCKNCNVSDLADTMENVAKNYDYYYCLAQANRYWAYNFSVESFKNKLEYFLFYDMFSDCDVNLMSIDQAKYWKIFCNKLKKLRLKYFLAQYDNDHDKEQLNNFLTLNGSGS